MGVAFSDWLRRGHQLRLRIVTVCAVGSRFLSPDARRSLFAFTVSVLAILTVLSVSARHRHLVFRLVFLEQKFGVLGADRHEFLAAEDAVNHGHEKERRGRGEQQAADDRPPERRVLFAAFAEAKAHRDHA